MIVKEIAHLLGHVPLSVKIPFSPHLSPRIRSAILRHFSDSRPLTPRRHGTVSGACPPPHAPPVQWLKLDSCPPFVCGLRHLPVFHHCPLSCPSPNPGNFSCQQPRIRQALSAPPSSYPNSPVISASPASVAPVIFHLNSWYRPKWTPRVLSGFLKYRSDFVSALLKLCNDFPLLLGLKSTWLVRLFMIRLLPVSLVSSSATD